MPLTDLVPLREYSSTLHSSKATDLAKLMLHAAKGLDYMHRLGLSFQDILPNNFGVMRDGSSSFLYDSSCLSLLDNHHGNISFCYEAVLSIANYMQHRVRGTTALESDRLGFITVIRQLFFRLKRGSSSKAKPILQKLKQCETVQSIVEILERCAGNTQSNI